MTIALVVFTIFFVTAELFASECVLLPGVGINVLVTLVIELSTLVTITDDSLSAVLFTMLYSVTCGFCILTFDVIECCFFSVSMMNVNDSVGSTLVEGRMLSWLDSKNTGCSGRLTGFGGMSKTYTLVGSTSRWIVDDLLG